LLCTAASDLAGFAAVRVVVLRGFAAVRFVVLRGFAAVRFVVLRAVVVRVVVVRFAAGLAAVREEDDFFGCGMGGTLVPIDRRGYRAGVPTIKR
jgi:hypothetical protein